MNPKQRLFNNLTALTALLEEQLNQEQQEQDLELQTDEEMLFDAENQTVMASLSISNNSLHLVFDQDRDDFKVIQFADGGWVKTIPATPYAQRAHDIFMGNIMTINNSYVRKVSEELAIDHSEQPQEEVDPDFNMDELTGGAQTLGEMLTESLRKAS